MFHEHKFNIIKNNLWCECGKVKRLECDHEWSVHSNQEIETRFNKTQTQQIVKCIVCGELKSINITTGQIE